MPSHWVPLSILRAKLERRTTYAATTTEETNTEDATEDATEETTTEEPTTDINTTPEEYTYTDSELVPTKEVS
ncbi:hypothetical protein B5X24_HaOG211193 [Helicoverpa armigera]|nr:hypothetical protein B5X24_HaOG211193 [Helicoverpa armigera]